MEIAPTSVPSNSQVTSGPTSTTAGDLYTIVIQSRMSDNSVNDVSTDTYTVTLYETGVVPETVHTTTVAYQGTNGEYHATLTLTKVATYRVEAYLTNAYTA